MEPATVAVAVAVAVGGGVKGKKRPAWLDRPARRQIALSQVPKAVNPANFLENYNIWYNKSSNFDQSTPYAPLPSSLFPPPPPPPPPATATAPAPATI